MNEIIILKEKQGKINSAKDLFKNIKKMEMINNENINL